MYHRACDNGNKDNWLWSEFRKWPRACCSKRTSRNIQNIGTTTEGGMMETKTALNTSWSTVERASGSDWTRCSKRTAVHVRKWILLLAAKMNEMMETKTALNTSWFTVHCVSGGDWTCSSKRSAGNLKHRCTATGLGVLQTSTESELLAGTV